MIEILNGMYETINYSDQSVFRLYRNHEPEDYPPHWHTGIEIIMPLENTYKVHVGSETFNMQPGEIIFIGSCETHSIEAPTTGSRIIFQFNLSLLYNLRGFDTAVCTLPPAIYLNSENQPELHACVQRLLKEIMEEYSNNNPLKEGSIYAKLIEIYVSIYRNNIYSTEKFSDVKIAKQHEYIDKFMGICNFINDHYNEDLTLEYVADVAGFSKFHFSRLFKKFSGITFYEYLCRKRITEAEKMFLNPTYSVTEVAMMTGFNSISTFNRVFKSVKNCSPTEYIKRVRRSVSPANTLQEFDHYFA